MKSSVALGCVLLLIAGCRDDKPKPAPAPSVADAAALAAKPSEVAQSGAVLSEPAVHTLLERWLAAQNAQDFAGYERLYASRFTGIKRAAERVTKYDREGWLRDRKGMFARGFTLQAERAQVRVLGASATVSFDQTFRSQSFSDHGPKQLIVVVEQGALKIAREEMLSSQLQGELADGALDDTAFSFVRAIEGRLFWTSNRAPVGLTVQGEPSLITAGAAFAKLPTAALPAHAQALLNKELTVHTRSGKSCDVKLSEFGVLAHFEPHFGDRSRWAGEDPDVKLSQAEIAREVFGPNEVSGRAHTLAVDITAQAQGCPDALWARAKALTPLQVAPVRTLQGANLEALLDRVRATASYKQAQKEHLEYGGAGLWDRQGATTGAAETTLGDGVFHYVNVFSFGDCSGFNANVSALYRTDGVRTRALPAVLGDQTGLPLFAADVNGDGYPEWIFETRLLAWNGKRYQVAIDAQPPSFDCPC